MKKEELESKTVAELRSLAKAKGLKGYSALRKTELVILLAGLRGAAAGETSGATKKPKKTVARKDPQKEKSRRGAGRVRRTSTRKRDRNSTPKDDGKDVESVQGRGLSPRTRRAFSMYRALGEQRIRASKYYLGPQDSPEIDQDFTFPQTYGESVVLLMVRDPYWLFAYWEFAPDLNAELVDRIGAESLASSRLALRVYDVTDSGIEGNTTYHDIDVAHGARDWYINVTRVERDYQVDIGLILPDGSFVVIARSNCVTLPPIGPSDEVDDRWVTLESLDEIFTLTERTPSTGSGGWGSGGWGRV